GGVGADLREKFEAQETTEESMRRLFPEELTPEAQVVRAMLNRLHRTMEEYGPFQGLIGYSEGALTAATLLIDVQQRCQLTGSENTLTHALFFSGWPPLDPDGTGVLLSDTDGQVIQCQTIHVLGSTDPYIHGSLALYEVCNEDKALIFDHGKGHLVPRERKVLKELVSFIRKHMTEG
ncbi:MAG: hypothetical protein Q9195_004194, partial [Heterodermia aff. obscurata]